MVPCFAVVFENVFLFSVCLLHFLPALCSSTKHVFKSPRVSQWDTLSAASPAAYIRRCLSICCVMLHCNITLWFAAQFLRSVAGKHTLVNFTDLNVSVSALLLVFLPNRSHLRLKANGSVSNRKDHRHTHTHSCSFLPSQCDEWEHFPSLLLCAGQ